MPLPWLIGAAVVAAGAAVVAALSEDDKPSNNNNDDEDRLRRAAEQGISGLRRTAAALRFLADSQSGHSGGQHRQRLAHW